MMHEIEPCITSVVINKQNISVTAFGYKGGGTLYIRVDKLKRGGGHRLTQGIRALQLFTKLAAKQTTSDGGETAPKTP